MIETIFTTDFQNRFSQPIFTRRFVKNSHLTRGLQSLILGHRLAHGRASLLDRKSLMTQGRLHPPVPYANLLSCLFLSTVCSVLLFLDLYTAYINGLFYEYGQFNFFCHRQYTLEHNKENAKRKCEVFFWVMALCTVED